MCYYPFLSFSNTHTHTELNMTKILGLFAVEF